MRNTLPRNDCRGFACLRLSRLLLFTVAAVLVGHVPGVPQSPPPPASTSQATQVLYPAAPPYGYYVLHTIGRKPDSPLRVVKVSEKRNKIIDVEEWWVGNRLAPITYEVPNPFRQITGNLPPVIPLEFRGHRVVEVIRSNPLLAIYGEDFSDGRYLLAINPNSGNVEVAFDFSAFQWPHEFDQAEKKFVKMDTIWAHLEDGILYVEHAHSTYARSSKRYNAYISALDTRTGMLLWRSKALVSNAQNFLVKNGTIITGYGFTAEPDFLYVLNQADGRILQKVPLKSAPEFFVEKDNKLFVRTYHTDYVFRFKK
jgi:hypothetical protein